MCMGSLVLPPRILAVVVIAGLIVVQTGTSQPVQVNSEPATAAQIAAVIGNDADARTVMLIFLKEAFRRRSVEIVQLSGATSRVPPMFDPVISGPRSDSAISKTIEIAGDAELIRQRRRSLQASQR